MINTKFLTSDKIEFGCSPQLQTERRSEFADSSTNQQIPAPLQSRKLADLLEKSLKKGWFSADELDPNLRKWLDDAPDSPELNSDQSHIDGTVLRTYWDNSGQGGSTIIGLRVKLNNKLYGLDFSLFGPNLNSDPETCIDVKRIDPLQITQTRSSSVSI